MEFVVDMVKTKTQLGVSICPCVILILFSTLLHSPISFRSFFRYLSIIPHSLSLSLSLSLFFFILSLTLSLSLSLSLSLPLSLCLSLCLSLSLSLSLSLYNHTDSFTDLAACEPF